MRILPPRNDGEAPWFLLVSKKQSKYTMRQLHWCLPAGSVHLAPTQKAATKHCHQVTLNKYIGTARNVLTSFKMAHYPLSYPTAWQTVSSILTLNYMSFFLSKNKNINQKHCKPPFLFGSLAASSPPHNSECLKNRTRSAPWVVATHGFLRGVMVSMRFNATTIGIVRNHLFPNDHNMIIKCWQKMEINYGMQISKIEIWWETCQYYPPFSWNDAELHPPSRRYKFRLGIGGWWNSLRILVVEKKFTAVTFGSVEKSCESLKKNTVFWVGG